LRDELLKLVRHGGVYGIGRMLTRGISFFLIPFYTYFLTTADYGVMEILNITTAVATILLALGLPNALMRFYYATDDAREQKEVVGTVLFASIALGVVSAGWMFLQAEPLARVLLGGSEHTLLMRLAAVSFFFQFSSDPGWVFLRAKQRSGLYVFLLQLTLLITVGVNIYRVAVWKMGAVGVFWGSLLAGAVQWVLLIWLTVRETGLRVSMGKLREMLPFGAPLVVTWLAAFALNSSDRFFLQHLTDISTVGIYALAYKFGYIVSLLGVQPFLLIWEAQCYEIAKRADASRIFSRFLAYFSVGLIGIAFLLSLFVREVFEIMVGRHFASAYAMVPLIALAYVIQGFSVYFQAGLLIQKKTRTVGAIGLASMLLCFLLNYLCISRWGAWGACAAAVLSFTFLTVTTFFYSQRAYPFPCDLGAVGRLLGLGILLFGLGALLPMESLALRILLKLGLVAAFLLALPKLGVFQDNELRAMRQSWTEFRNRKQGGMFRWAGAPRSVPKDLG
jgi:O-antigen/teichoic acid export membrane protein